MTASGDADDARHAIIGLCLRLPGDPNFGIRPLTGGELTDLQGWVRQHDTPLQAVLGDASLAPVALRARIRGLIERWPAVSLEIERLDRLGMQLLTRDSLAYPQRLLLRLKTSAPAVLCVAGSLPAQAEPCLAITGSRQPVPESSRFAAELGDRCGREGVTIVSGGADGIDTSAAEAALEADGNALLFMAESIERRLRDRRVRGRIESGQLTLVTPFHPAEAFSAANAHGRNRLIYSAADVAIVAEARAGHGGTWRGACECLDHGWTPLFVRHGSGMTPGNEALLAYQGYGSARAIALPSLPAGELMGGLERLRGRQPSLLDVLQASLAGLATAATGDPGGSAPEPAAELADDTEQPRLL